MSSRGRFWLGPCIAVALVSSVLPSHALARCPAEDPVVSRAPSVLLELVDAGKAPDVTQVDAVVEVATIASIDSLVDGCALRGSSAESAIRAAAASTLRHLRGFPARDAVRAEAGEGGWAVDPAKACDRTLRVIGRLGDGSDLLLAAAAAERASAPLPTGRTRASLQQTCVHVLDRDPGASAGFRRAYEAADEALLTTLVDALRARGTVADLQLAHRLLGRRPGNDSVVLNRMQLLTRAGDPGFGDAERGRIRDYLDHTDPRCRAAAAGLVSRLDDHEAIPQLVARLDDEERIVRGPSHTALKSLTRLRFGPSAERWRHWHSFEVNWWHERGAELLRSLPNLTGAKLLDSLNELTAHPLYRRQIGPAVAPLLAGRDETLVRMALSVLEATRCSSETAAIEALIHDARPAVAGQARVVLASLTGRPLPVSRPRLDRPADLE